MTKQDQLAQATGSILLALFALTLAVVGTIVASASGVYA